MMIEKKRLNVFLEEPVIHRVKAIGGGSFSNGIRLLVMMSEGQIKIVEQPKEELNKKDLVPQEAPKKRTSNQPKVPAISSEVREAYCEAFKQRYGMRPFWAAKENSQANQLIKQVGIQDAIKLAKDYLQLNDPFILKVKHSFGYLVSNPSKVMVEMANPNRMLDSYVANKQLVDKTETLEEDRRVGEIKLKAEISRIAFEIAKKTEPDLTDYEFKFKEFLLKNGIDPDSNLHEINQKVLSLSKTMGIIYDKR